MNPGPRDRIVGNNRDNKNGNGLDYMLINSKIQERIPEIVKSIQCIDEKTALPEVWKERKQLERLLRKHARRTMIAGNIGFGKTNATEILATYGRAQEVHENDNNPILKLYYQDMKKHSKALQIDLICFRSYEMAFHSQLYKDEPLVFDRTTYEDPDIFCHALYQAGLMEKEELHYCLDYFNIKKEDMETRFSMSLDPDLVIFLQGDIEVGWRRVLTRNRAIELQKDATLGRGLPREFYEILHAQYEQFLDRLSKRYQGLIITLPQDVVEVSDATSSRGILYVVRGVTESLKIVDEFNSELAKLER